MTRPRCASRLVVAAAMIAATGCGVRLFVPPTGGGAPAPETEAALAAATSHCAEVRALVVSMGMKGRVGAQGLPRGVRYDAAIARDGRIFLEASALGRQRLVFAGGADRATLWLSDGNRAVDAPAPAIIEALTGLALTPPQLLDLLTGCVTSPRTFERGERFGDRLQASVPDATIVLEPAAGAWRVRWARVRDLRADYHAAEGQWPRELTLYTADTAPLPAQLTLTLRSREVDPPDADLARAFAYVAPASATRLTLDELRDAVWRHHP